MIPPDPVRIDPRACTAHLRILATTDLHMHLRGYDYFTDQRNSGFGLAHTASLIRPLRDAVATCLLLDNGDFLQGNPLSDWMAERDRAAAVKMRPIPENPMIAAMNALGYDAGTLGNHEFNYGLGFLQRALGQARFPIVSANITTAQGDSPLHDTHFVPPYAVLDRLVTDTDGGLWPIRIGVIGFAPPQIVLWERLQLGNAIGTRDIVAAARAHVPALRAAGADIVIALCHSGIGADQHEDGMENAAVPLAAVPGIDVIVTGHTHQVFPGPGVGATPAVDPVRGTIHGKPTVMTGFQGSHLGVIDLTLDRRDGRWQMAAHTVRVESIAPATARSRMPKTQPDLALTAITEKTHRQLLRQIRRPVGRTAVALHSYFSVIGPDAALQVVADAQRARAQAVLAGGPWDGLPILSAAAPFKMGGRGGPAHFLDISAGPLLQRHASELYLYPNAFCILVLSGHDIAEWLERSASIFLTINPGDQDQPMIDPAFPGYNFDLLDGVTYRIDPTQPPRTDSSGRTINVTAQRVIDLALDGTPLAAADRVLVATNSYRAGGGGGFDAAMRGQVIYQGAGTTRDVVLDHMRRTSLLQPQIRPTWQFRSLPGTSAWFDTGPGAERFERGVAGVTPMFTTPEGFRRYRLAF